MYNCNNDYQKFFRHLNLESDSPGWAYPPNEWGTTALRSEDTSGSTVFQARRDPEGLILISRCLECGGRHESLVPFTRSGSRGKLEMLRNVGPALGRTTDFAQSHQCPTGGHRQGRKVRGLLDEALSRAKRSLRRGGQVAPGLSLLTSGGALRVGLEDVNGIEDVYLRRTVQAGLKCGVRTEIRRKGLKMKAAVAISESWQAPDDGGRPSLSPHRQESLLLVIATADYSLMRNYPIKRDSGIPDLGPGTLGQPLDSSVIEDRILDGLFAWQDQPCTS